MRKEARLGGSAGNERTWRSDWDILPHQAMALKYEPAWGSLHTKVVKTGVWFYPQGFWCRKCGWGLEMCISNSALVMLMVQGLLFENSFLWSLGL